jgi:hypothetical protein
MIACPGCNKVFENGEDQDSSSVDARGPHWARYRMNANIGHPGYFYRLPFFIGPAPA